MYNSPIAVLVSDIKHQIAQQHDEQIYQAVVHGRWEEWWPPKHMILTGEEMLYRCSACTAKYADISGLNYCPFCGARMDLQTEVTDEPDFI